jgi:hypothetical protein
MSILDEVYAFIRHRGHYWLIPFFVPVLAVYGLALSSRFVVSAAENLPLVATAFLRKLHNALAVIWVRTHLRYSRHT